MTKHTPGPQQALEEIVRNRVWDCFHDHTITEDEIPSLVWADYLQDVPSAAAAAEMLEALRELVHQLECIRKGYTTGCGERSASLDNARAILARIEGK